MISVIIGEVLSHDNHVLQMLPPLSFLLFSTVLSFICALCQHGSCPCQKLIYDLILLSLMRMWKNTPLILGVVAQTFNCF